MSEYISLVEISFDSGTRYYSYQGVSAPSNWYKDQVIAIGAISREISLVPGEYRVSDCSITFANTDLEFSILKGDESFRGKTVTIRFGDPSGGLAAMTTVYTGKITGWNLNTGIFEISTTDITTQRFESTLGGLISSGVFVGIADDTRNQIYPIIYGNPIHFSASGAGAVPCRLVDTTGPYLYLVARHVCKNVGSVYRMGVLVPSTEYTVTTGSYGGYTMTLLSFTIDQRDAADLNTGNEIEWPERNYTTNDDIHITADVAGTTNDGTTGGTIIDNPVEALKHYLKTYAGFVDADFDSTMWTSTSTKVNSLSYSCDFVLCENLTHREFIEKFCESFGLSFFITRTGKLGVGLLNLAGLADLSSATEYSDSNDIFSFRVNAQDEYASKILYKYMYNYPQKYFVRQQELVDYTERERLDGLDKSVSSDMYFTHNFWTAWMVSQARLNMLRECQNIVGFSLPIENFNVDLNSVIKITHREGIGAAGYSGRGAIILGTSLTIDARSLGLSVTAFPISEPFVSISSAGQYSTRFAMLNSTVFLAVDTGDIQRSSDGGNNWTNVGSLTNATDVLDIFYSGNNTVFCGGANNGVGRVWRSTDAGNTWGSGNDLSGTTGTRTFLKLTSNRVLAFCSNNTTQGQIFYSDDSGNTWNNLVSTTGWRPDKVLETAVGSLAGTWLNSTDNYVHARTSADNGSTWTDRGALGTSTECFSMINCNNGVLLAGVGNDTGNNCGAIYRSTNNGANWTSLKTFSTLCNRISSLVNMGSGVYLAGDAEDGNQGWIYGGNIRYTADYGTTWRTLQRLGLSYDVRLLSNPTGNQVVAMGVEMAYPQSTGRCYKAAVIP
jgi:hypothetical protein